MKTIFCHLIIAAAMFCSIQAHAQKVKQYEYATLYLAVDTKTVLFIKPDGTSETSDAKRAPDQVRGVNPTSYNWFYAINEVLNQKGKEGWELVTMNSAPNAGNWILRRQLQN